MVSGDVADHALSQRGRPDRFADRPETRQPDVRWRNLAAGAQVPRCQVPRGIERSGGVRLSLCTWSGQQSVCRHEVLAAGQQGSFVQVSAKVLVAMGQRTVY